MKKTLYGIVFFTSIILTSCSQSRQTQGGYNSGYDSYNTNEYNTTNPSNSITYQQFYDNLSPYGQWIDNPEYGYVWSPQVSGFRPYSSNGNWEYTNYGWTWVSNYNWGWATFHYGRWFYDDFNGWMWVPGYEWAPAWVSWRTNSEYYGWAPMCPRNRNGSFYQVGYDQWSFVPHQYINRRDINNYYINQQNNVTIINNSTEINTPRTFKTKAQYQPGPSVTEVEKYTRSKIRPLEVKQSVTPGDEKLQNGALRIYKPVVQQGKLNQAARPAKLIGARDIPSQINPRINQNQGLNNNNNVKVAPVQGQLNNNLPQRDQSPVIKNNNANISQPDTRSRQADLPVINPRIPNNNSQPANTNSNNQLEHADRKLRQFQNNREQQVPVNIQSNTNETRVNQNNTQSDQRPDYRLNTQPVRSIRSVEPKNYPGADNNSNKISNNQQRNFDTQNQMRERAATINSNRQSNNTFERPQSTPERSSPPAINKFNKRNF